MRKPAQKIALLTSCAVLVALAWPDASPVNAIVRAAMIAMAGLGLLYPWALSREQSNGGITTQRDMQEIDVGPATTAILF